jgi:hypothetical protein
MPVWELILIVAAAVVVVAVVIVAATVGAKRNKTKRMRQHYGREYERLVSETGNQKEAERELTARERKRDKLDIVPLTPSALTDFTTRWHEVQTGFVDNPATDDFDQRAADISVDHPQIVDDYRTAHGIHVAQERGEVSTEQQREAFVHYRSLFAKLLESKTDDNESQEASA